MGLSMFKKNEDRPTPPEVYNLYTYLLAMGASWASVMIGYDSAFIGTSLALDSFKEEFGLVGASASRSADINAEIVSAYQGGCLAGAVLGYPVGLYLGRKWGLFVWAACFCLGAGVMLAANGERGYTPLVAGRVIAGLGVGACSNLTPLYISEISPPAIRGQLTGQWEIGWQVGGIVGFWINYGVATTLPSGFQQWFIPFAVQLIPGGLFLMSIPFLTESPRWFMMRGKREKAIKALSKIRHLPQDHPYLIEEINALELQHEHDVNAVGDHFFSPFLGILRSRALITRFFITTTLFMWQNGTGINAINYYSPTIFAAIGLRGTNTRLLTTGIFGVIKIVISLIWAFFLIDRFGRRILFIVGAAGGAISMYIIAGYIQVAAPQDNPTDTIPPSGVMALAFFYIWTIFYGGSWNGGPWVVNAECFPGAVRQAVAMSASASNWLWNLVIARATPTMFISMQGHGPFYFFATMQLLSIIYVVLLLPETKEIPLEEMDRLWNQKNKWTANKVVMAELQRENALNTNPHYLHEDKPNEHRVEDHKSASSA